MSIHLVYLAKPVRGGWPTYVGHLAHGLQAAGYPVELWRVGKRTEKQVRSFGRGLVYRNASVEYLAEIARSERMHIAAAEPGRAFAVGALLRAGAGITIHDPTELKGDLPAALESSRRPVVVIRKAVAAHIPGETRFVRHPYMRLWEDGNGGRAGAVAFSRLDWDKGTHHIVAANAQVSPDRAVRLYGAENRLYTHHKLEAVDPDWRRFYRGQWPTDDLWGAVRLAATARLAVDMSSIKGDGGGTQYTFLEALDGGAALVLNKAWLTGNAAYDGELEAAATFIDPEDLPAALEGERPVFDAGPLLTQHNAATRAVETVGLA